MLTQEEHDQVFDVLEREGSLKVSAIKEFVIHQVMIGEFAVKTNARYLDTDEAVREGDSAYMVTFEDAMGIDGKFYFESEESARDYIIDEYGPKVRIVVASLKHKADTEQSGDAWVRRYLDTGDIDMTPEVKTILESGMSYDEKVEAIKGQIEEAIQQSDPSIQTVDWGKINFDYQQIYKVIDQFQEDKVLEEQFKKESPNG